MQLGQTEAVSLLKSQLFAAQGALSAAVSDPSKASQVPVLTAQVNNLAKQITSMEGGAVSTVSSFISQHKFIILGILALGGLGAFFFFRKKLTRRRRK